MTDLERIELTLRRVSASYYTACREAIFLLRIDDDLQDGKADLETLFDLRIKQKVKP